MATSMASATRNHLCVMCSPKQVSAITSCKGCSKDLCRKHFNQHRDTLSDDINNVFDRHDNLLQNLYAKIEDASNSSNSCKTHTIFEEIDKWETTTIHRVSQVAEETRRQVNVLFNRKEELDIIKQKIGKITEELKEQQELENFVETDIQRWINRIEQLQADIIQPSKGQMSPPVLQIQNIDWSEIVTISSPFKMHKKANVYDVESETNTVTPLSMECPICASDYPTTEMERMFLCDAVACSDCTKAYYRLATGRIQDPESLKKLTCILEPHDISDDVKGSFFQYLEAKMNEWFPDERPILDTYHENLILLTRDPRLKKCGNLTCSAFFENDINNNKISCISCEYCQFEQCQRCRRKWFKQHTNMSCGEYAEWFYAAVPTDPEVALKKYSTTVGIVCPNEKCKAIYEYRPGGSEHFTCQVCETDFCRTCSALFFNPTKNSHCQRPNCRIKNRLHVHCSLNCFGKIRGFPKSDIIQFLTANKINVEEELREKPQATGLECPVEGCGRAVVVSSENRFCGMCYRQFLCSLVWRYQLEPWDLHPGSYLQKKLVQAGVTVPTNSTRANIIALARQHLSQYLGKPNKIRLVL